MSKPTIYLAGPVAALDDGGASWREEVAALAGRRGDFNVRDPLSKYNAPAENIDIREDADPDADGEVTPAEIVESDKDLLRESDAVLVGYTDVQSIGTPMEVMWAYDHYKPVIVWIRDETGPGDLSPWYRYHADAVTETRAAAVSQLLNYADE